MILIKQMLWAPRCSQQCTHTTIDWCKWKLKISQEEKNWVSSWFCASFILSDPTIHHSLLPTWTMHRLLLRRVNICSVTQVKLHSTNVQWWGFWYTLECVTHTHVLTNPPTFMKSEAFNKPVLNNYCNPCTAAVTYREPPNEPLAPVLLDAYIASL